MISKGLHTQLAILIMGTGLPSLVCVIVVLFASFGCAPGNVVPDDAIVIDGLERSFSIFDPENLGTLPAPVVFVLHGGFGNADTISRIYFEQEWKTLASLNHFLVVYPEGRADLTGGGRHWNDCRSEEDILVPVNLSTEDDAQFLLTLIDWIDARYVIDRSRIYFTGFSNGGLMTIRSAIEMGEEIAAIAPLGASMVVNSECSEPILPMPILFMLGTDDDLVPDVGGCLGSSCGIGRVMSIDESIEVWTTLNQTSTTPTVVSLPDLVPSDNSTIDIFTYASASGDSDVVYYRVNGGGHNVPGPSPFSEENPPVELGVKNQDVYGADEVWAFFARQVRTSIGENSPPTVVNDGPQSVPIDSEGVFVNVLDNDTDADGDTLFLVGVIQPEHGVVSLWEDRGKVVYRPDALYAGIDEFAYYVADGRGGVRVGKAAMIVE